MRPVAGRKMADQTYFSVRNLVACSPASIWEKCMKFAVWNDCSGHGGGIGRPGDQVAHGRRIRHRLAEAIQMDTARGHLAS